MSMDTLFQRSKQFEMLFELRMEAFKRIQVVASPRGMGGSGPPTSVQTLLGISANPLKSFFTYRGVIPCMYIITFTAHQQRNMVRTLPLFWGWRRHCIQAQFKHKLSTLWEKGVRYCSVAILMSYVWPLNFKFK